MLGFTFLSCYLNAALIASTPHLIVDQPENKMIDQKIEIRIGDLDPFQEVEIHARTWDQKENLWSAHAKFQADSLGKIDISTSNPLEGSSYGTADAMGLFWSMLPASNDPTAKFKCGDGPSPVDIQLWVNDALIEETRIIRYLKASAVQRVAVKEDGLVGTLFIPDSAKPLPVVITLGGSEGGLAENWAKFLASNGFAVLALGYFGVEGLPSNLQDIPLEYFETAFAWLKKQPNVDASHIGLCGASRGAELSLILGSIFPDSVQAIAAIAPSSVVYGGLNETPVNAWLYQGKPILPFALEPQIDCSGSRGQNADSPINLRENFLEGMKDTVRFEAAVIPVENIRCPLLLVSGGDDQMWPSEIYADQIVDRLEATDTPIEVTHWNYPDAGHGFSLPNLPVRQLPVCYHPFDKLWFTMGGNREADARASRDAWKELLAFFHENLSRATATTSSSAENRIAIETSIMPEEPPVSLQERMHQLHVPGVSIAVINKGKIEWAKGYGDLADATTQIQAASISKTVTALTILSLIDQCEQAARNGHPSGLVDGQMITLDTDVSTLLEPELWASIDPNGITSVDLQKMTLGHLLSHTAGTTVHGFIGYSRIEDLEEIDEKMHEIQARLDSLAIDSMEREGLSERLDELELLRASAREHLPSVDQILRGEGNSDPVTVVEVPGTKISYSGGGTTILQKIVIKLTGQRFEDVVQERVFTKLGMDHSTYHPEPSRTSQGHDIEGTPIRGSHIRYPELAAAGLWTTSIDVAKMAVGIQHAIAGNKDSVISQRLAQEMIKSQFAGGHVALGLFIEEGVTSRYFSHGGSNVGFKCIMCANTDGRGAVIMTNADNGGTLFEELLIRIAEVYDWPDRKEVEYLHTSKNR